MQTGTSNEQVVIPGLRKITFAFDGSENSLQALEAAAIIAKGYGAEVSIAYALQPSSIFSTMHQREEYYTKLESNASKSIEKAMSFLVTNEVVKARSKILHSRGSITESLIDYVSEEKSDLVVCGTRGLGGFDRMLLGSISGQLVSHSPSPVLVVRKPEAAKKMEIKRILVATDGSETASRAMGLAISLAKALGGKLTFVNVVYLPPISYGVDEGIDFNRLMADLREDGEKITKEAIFIAQKMGVEADRKIIDGLRSPSMAITELAEKEKYDLIAVGTRGRGEFKRLILGSVANGVVHYAHCSVLVAR